MDLLSRIRIDPVTGCHEWTGNSSRGYGIIDVRGRGLMKRRILLAHRVMWEMAHGFTSAEHVHHMCENPPCVNPEHLQPMTPRKNNRLAYSTWRDGCCERGHTDIRLNRAGGHYCRTCNTERMRSVRARKRGDRND